MEFGMKRALICAVGSVVFWASAAFAQETITQADVDRTCSAVGDFAAAVMERRQGGTPLSDMMALATRQDDGGAFMRPFILSAFDKPQMRTPENQRQYVVDFRADNELACFVKFQAQVTK